MKLSYWWVFILGLVFLLLATVASTLFAAQANTQAGQEGGNQAALVVRYGEDRVETYCVSFAEAEISGYELLERAVPMIEAQEVGMGASVCRLDDVGCAASNCFCQCRGGACKYWSYWQLREGSWQYSVVGASLSTAAHGDVQGWSWGPGSVSEATAPPAYTFDAICGNVEAGDATAMTEVTPGSGAAVSTIPTAMATPPAAGEDEDGESVALEENVNETGRPHSYVGFGLIVAVLVFIGLAAARRSSQ